MQKQFRDLATGERFVHQIIPGQSVLVEATTPAEPLHDGTVWVCGFRVISRTGTILNLGYEGVLSYRPETEVTVTEEQAQRDLVQITIDVEVLGGINGSVMQAIEDLAAIMLVQAEDGLYTTGYKEGDGAEFLRDFGAATRVASVKQVQA